MYKLVQTSLSSDKYMSNPNESTICALISK